MQIRVLREGLGIDGPHIQCRLQQHVPRCVQDSWPVHRHQHKASLQGWHYCGRRGTGRILEQPDFPWTGSLRPYQIGPMRPIPDSIVKPDYFATGYAKHEVDSRQQRSGEGRARCVSSDTPSRGG